MPVGAYAGESDVQRIRTLPSTIALYSTRLQTYQFRIWAFFVAISGKVARLFRRDRAGR